MNRFVEVAIDNAALAFDRLYTYKVPEELWEFALTGARVLVPFGRADAPRMGVIMGNSECRGRAVQRDPNKARVCCRKAS